VSKNTDTFRSDPDHFHEGCKHVMGRCPVCKGNGKVQFTFGKCTECNGVGHVMHCFIHETYSPLPGSAP
jgi:RecJ-like exonuclease